MDIIHFWKINTNNVDSFATRDDFCNYLVSYEKGKRGNLEYVADFFYKNSKTAYWAIAKKLSESLPFLTSHMKKNFELFKQYIANIPNSIKYIDNQKYPALQSIVKVRELITIAATNGYLKDGDFNIRDRVNFVSFHCRIPYDEKYVEEIRTYSTNDIVNLIVNVCRVKCLDEYERLENEIHKKLSVRSEMYKYYVYTFQFYGNINTQLIFPKLFGLAIFKLNTHLYELSSTNSIILEIALGHDYNVKDQLRKMVQDEKNVVLQHYSCYMYKLIRTLVRIGLVNLARNIYFSHDNLAYSISRYTMNNQNNITCPDAVVGNSIFRLNNTTRLTHPISYTVHNCLCGRNNHITKVASIFLVTKVLLTYEELLTFKYLARIWVWKKDTDYRELLGFALNFTPRVRSISQVSNWYGSSASIIISIVDRIPELKKCISTFTHFYRYLFLSDSNHEDEDDEYIYGVISEYAKKYKIWKDVVFMYSRFIGPKNRRNIVKHKFS